MNNKALLRPKYLELKHQYKEPYNRHIRVREFRLNEEGKVVYLNGYCSLGFKNVIKDHQLSLEFYVKSECPHERGSVQYETWWKGYEDALAEQSSGCC